MHDKYQDLRSRSDDELMTSVRDDRCLPSFEVLVERWRQPVVRHCYRMIFSWDDAEDMTQDVFARLYQNRFRYQPTARFTTYLWSIAINRCRDFLRSAKRENQNHQELLIKVVSDATLEPHSNDSAERVQLALKKLPTIYREVLVLRHYESLKFNEIAKVLKVPFGTVASRMSKALRLLGEQLSADSIKGETCHESPNQ